MEDQTKVQVAPAVEAPSDSNKDLHEALSDRAAAMQAVAKARETLGKMSVESNGVVLTPRETTQRQSSGPQGDVPVGGRASG